MTDSDQAHRWQQVRALFDQVADCDPADWPARLLALCPEDERLRDEALALLVADAAVTGGATGVSGSAPDLLDALLQAGAPEHDPWPGRRLGPWRILECVGRGGMGRVYRARREDGDFAQQVAIKLVDQVGDQSAVARRLRSERQILAGLQHPNIAGLVDGGMADDGTPWFALEYVEGEPVTDWCDRNRLTVEGRLKRFLAVCAAVAHAHERLVVHRDLKPANILVGSDGQVKLLDFGIAKLLDGDEGDAVAGSTVLRAFTPAYAAPEQIRGEPPTTAVDVYALGLLLHELLTGRLPWRGEDRKRTASTGDADPQRPSSQVQRTAPVDAGTPTPEQVASQRDTTPARLRQRLRGDLDAIVMKALRPQPARRYDGVRALAEDVRAVLERRPVAARQGGTRYLFERFLARHALAASLAVLAGVSLLTGAAVALHQAQEARAQRNQAQEQARRADAVADFLIGVFRGANPRLTDGRDPPASELLARGAESLLAREDLDGATRANLLNMMASVHIDLSLYTQALALAEQGLVSALAAGEPRLEAASLTMLGRAANNAGDRPAAAAHLERAWAVVREAGIDDPDLLDVIDHVSTVVHNNLRDLPRALHHLERTIARARARGAPVATRSVLMYSTVLNALDRAGEALAVTGPALAAARQQAGLSRHDLGTLISAHAFALLHGGSPEQAEALFRESLAISQEVEGAGSHAAITDLHNMRAAIAAQARHDEAVELAREVLRLSRLHPTIGAAQTSRSLAWAGISEVDAGNPLAALPLFEELFDRDPTLSSMQPRVRLLVAVARAQALAAAGDWPHAWQVADQALSAGGSDGAQGPLALATLRLVRLQAHQAGQAGPSDDCDWLAEPGRALPDDTGWRRQLRAALVQCRGPGAS
ncbi:MAG: serine/threonine protein kinase [Xanthomonadales bacterium]|nr:serine/threonine protein kinase [Xanthomonadales bacterium]